MLAVKLLKYRYMIAAVVLAYALLYVVFRCNHYLVNYNGHMGCFGIGSFSEKASNPTEPVVITSMSYYVFFPLVKIESMLRHGPMAVFGPRIL
jgi:hypothetical protein